jgi:hypothetical protein
MEESALPCVVSFYTKDTPYEEEVKNLVRSCEKFGVEYQIEAVSSTGSWEMNCAFKPIFILQKLQELKRPLLWVDADAVFVQKLSFCDAFHADLGVRMYDCPDDHPSRIVSSTVFIHKTSAAKKVVRLWAEECLDLLADKSRKQEVWDQDALRRVVFTKAHGASIKALPPVYSKIVDHPEDEKNCPFPIIVQNQASRRYKRWIYHPEERIFGW